MGDVITRAEILAELQLRDRQRSAGVDWLLPCPTRDYYLDPTPAKDFEELSSGQVYERDILIALQPLYGSRPTWEALCAEIRIAPPEWRWWVRRHPLSNELRLPHEMEQYDFEFLPLLAMDMPNVVVTHAARMPMRDMVRHMSVVISFCSASSKEAAVAGTPAFFLDQRGCREFPALVGAGFVKYVAVQDLNAEIAALPTRAQ